MAILDRLPDVLIKKVFTHKGFYAGIVPVYMTIEDGVDYDVEGTELFLTERNWIPGGSVTLVRSLWRLFTIFYPSNPPVYITGELNDSEV